MLNHTIFTLTCQSQFCGTVRIADYHGGRGGRGLGICNIRQSAKRSVFLFVAMPAGELAMRRCLLATEYLFSAQRLQRLRSLYGMY